MPTSTTCWQPPAWKRPNGPHAARSRAVVIVGMVAGMAEVTAAAPPAVIARVVMRREARARAVVVLTVRAKPARVARVRTANAPRRAVIVVRRVAKAAVVAKMATKAAIKATRPADACAEPLQVRGFAANLKRPARARRFFHARWARSPSRSAATQRVCNHAATAFNWAWLIGAVSCSIKMPCGRWRA
jgi:hypothetical protein